MDNNIILWILGIIVTFILAYWGVRATFKTTREVKLLYLQENWIPLFDAIVKNMEGIEITYQHTPIEPSLILLKGCFLNIGNVDIDSKHIYQPVTITLPDDLKWKEVKVVDTPAGVNVVSRAKDDVNLEFGWDLLKKTECFKFDALIDASRYLTHEVKLDRGSFSKMIKISHRITDLDKVATSRDLRFRPKTILVGFLIGLLMAVLLSLAERTIFADKFVQYSLEQPGKTPILVRLNPLNNNMFRIRGITEDFSEVIRADELNTLYKLTNPTSVKEIPSLVIGTILPGIWMLLLCASIYVIIDTYSGMKKFFKMAKINL